MLNNLNPTPLRGTPKCSLFLARVTFLNAADEVGAFESVTLSQNPSHRLHFGVPRSGVVYHAHSKNIYKSSIIQTFTQPETFDRKIIRSNVRAKKIRSNVFRSNVWTPNSKRQSKCGKRYRIILGIRQLYTELNYAFRYPTDLCIDRNNYE